VRALHDRLPESACLTISKSHDEIADTARFEILPKGICGERSLQPAAAQKQNLRGSDAVADFGLKTIVQRSVLIIDESETAAIGEESSGSCGVRQLKFWNIIIIRLVATELANAMATKTAT